MPFILCAMICCCLPCIVSIIDVHEDTYGMRRETEESINALPTHKFNGNGNARDENSRGDQGGYRRNVPFQGKMR